MLRGMRSPGGVWLRELLIHDPTGSASSLAGRFRFLPRMTWLRICFRAAGSLKDDEVMNAKGLASGWRRVELPFLSMPLLFILVRRER